MAQLKPGSDYHTLYLMYVRGFIAARLGVQVEHSRLGDSTELMAAAALGVDHGSTKAHVETAAAVLGTLKNMLRDPD
jgi:hypothetical protein